MNEAFRGAVAALLLAAAGLAAAGPFEVGIAPSRFELSARPGGRLGQSVMIQNVGGQPTQLVVRTLDWSYSPAGTIGYREDLAPGSCRPWVTLERRKLTLAPRAGTSFRFQVDVPADAPRGECRFMLAIEGADPATVSRLANGALSLPVAGRIAVAVYVAVGGARPRLTVDALHTGQAPDGRRLALVTVSNQGDAHGRLDGSLDAEDARGRKFELVPDGSPVMPGQTRHLALAARPLPGQPSETPEFPLKASGRLDWDEGSFKVNAEFK